MVRIAVLLVAVACGAAPPAPAPVSITGAGAGGAAPVIDNRAPTPSCAAAAERLARGASDPGDPDVDLRVPLRARCEHDGWTGEARACFATMRDGELGRCAAELAGTQRAALFDVLAGGVGDRGQLAVTRARLQAMAIGLGACDRFIAQVATALDCEAMPLDQRLSLGNETATMWDVPIARLTPRARDQMAAACDASLADLERQIRRAGCAP